jgi:cell division protein FtsB
MKREHIRACIFLGLSLLRLPAMGQDAAAARPAATPAVIAATVAEQQGVDEKFKQLAADIDTLRAANQLLQEKVTALTQELQQVHAEQARQAAGAVSRDDLKRLALQIEEVDKKRMEDKEAISLAISNTTARLLPLLTNPVDSAPKPAVRGPAPPAPTAAADGFSYTIKDGHRPTAIVKAYNDDFRSKGMKTITLQQVIDANPGVDWKHLRIGQKIVIPRPPS